MKKPKIGEHWDLVVPQHYLDAVVSEFIGNKTRGTHHKMPKNWKKESGERNRKNFKGKTFEEMYGIEKAKILKNNLSKCKKYKPVKFIPGRDNDQSGKNHPLYIKICKSKFLRVIKTNFSNAVKAKRLNITNTTLYTKALELFGIPLWEAKKL